jgi:hypothetical protein
MNYYFYENWTAEKKAVIHVGSCGHCKEGKGCHENPLGDLNGEWHGPYKSLQLAKQDALKTNRPVREHRCVPKN